MATQTTKPRAGLRALPSVDELLRAPRLAALAAEAGRRLVLLAARQVLARLRQEMRAGAKGLEPRLAELPQEVAAEVAELLEPSLRPVINATGVILHTNLGRAPLGAEAARRVFDIATQYSNLEFDLGRGARGERHAHAARLLSRLLGCEASLVVNNNAAAVLLALNTLAEGGEVIVSRGELVEIGGSFRIPEVCEKSGAVLREAGTTNRTRLGDYARAINKRTRLLLRVHPSNFKQVGFVERPNLDELVALARRRRIPLVEDLGSGLVANLAELKDEPMAQASLAAGADLVTFSGDKLLGGPQAGILAGKKALVEHCRRNPLYRALRVDKLTYAALEGTIQSCLKGKLEEVPVLRLIRQRPDEIGERAERLRAKLETLIGDRAALRVVNGKSVIGGGSAPGVTLPTQLVAIRPRALSAAELAARLRRASPPVIARVEAERVLLDLRTVFEEQEAALTTAIGEALRD